MSRLQIGCSCYRDDAKENKNEKVTEPMVSERKWTAGIGEARQD